MVRLTDCSVITIAVNVDVSHKTATELFVCNSKRNVFETRSILTQKINKNKHICTRPH